MLGHHAASRAALSVLQTSSPAVTVAASAALERTTELLRLRTGSVRHRPYSTSVSSKQPWAVASRRSAAAVAPQNHQHLRQRRPIVNGESVAFHVNDLLRRTSPPPPPLAPPFPAHRSPPLSAPPATPSLYGLGSLNNLNAPNSYVAKSAASDVNNSRYESDLVVILDMDECLIHSQFLSPQNAQFFAYQLLKQQGKTHRFTNNAGDGGQPQQHQPPRRVDTIRFTLPDGDLVHVNLRPGLSEFLKAVTAKYETHIFTAAMNIYADPLLDQLDPTGTMLAGRWYREHCVYDPARQVYIKDLDRLVPLLRRSSTSTGSSPSLSAAASSLLSRVVLVDNNPLSFLANPSNGILVSSFYNDPGDTSLQNVWQLLQELDRQQDVRPHLERRFGLKSALAKLLGKDKKSQSQGQTSRTQHEPHHRCVQQVQSA